MEPALGATPRATGPALVTGPARDAAGTPRRTVTRQHSIDIDQADMIRNHVCKLPLQATQLRHLGGLVQLADEHLDNFKKRSVLTRCWTQSREETTKHTLPICTHMDGKVSNCNGKLCVNHECT